MTCLYSALRGSSTGLVLLMMDEDFLRRLYPGQAGDGAFFAAHRNVADRTGQRRTGVSAAQFGIAPEGAVDQDHVAAIVDFKKFFGDFGERWRVCDAEAVGFQDEGQCLPCLFLRRAMSRA